MSFEQSTKVNANFPILETTQNNYLHKDFESIYIFRLSQFTDFEFVISNLERLILGKIRIIG